MKKRFNIAGPCVPERHYMLPAAPRLPEAPDLIEQGAYFAVHAPRQTGKTTTLAALAHQLTAAGDYAALHFSCQNAGAIEGDIGAAEDAILSAIRYHARYDLPPDLHPPDPWPAAAASARLMHAIGDWASRCPRPLVLFIDEIDSLTDSVLISVLSQLRVTFPYRPRGAAWSVALCGLRDVRDYKAASGGDPTRLGSSSPFNIKTKSVLLGNFTRDEIARLYGQHTAAAGQPFTDAAVDRAHALTAGQPWLVNALANEVIEEMGITEAIDTDHLETARRRLARAKATHLDSLLKRLSEPRVRRVIEPIVIGGNPPARAFDEDYTYARDLGLVIADPELRITNPIYAEVITRALADAIEASGLPGPRAYVTDGRLDMTALLRGFGEWWTQHGETLDAPLDYHEAAPHLVLMAFLQRVVNGGGFVDREYSIGRLRLDLLVRWPLADGTWQREAIEVKVRSDRSHRGDPLAPGLEQLDAYLTRLDLDHGTLVIFDRRADRDPIDERVTLGEAATPTGRPVRVLRA